MGGWNKLKLDDDLLASIYTQGESLREIARRFGTDSNTIKSHLKSIGIKTRTYSEAYGLRLKKHGAPNHNEGYKHNHNGYVFIRVREDNPYFTMASNRFYVAEHRLIMAQYLGRCLSKDEVVHHLNGIKDDNRIENLILLSPTNHRLNEMYCQKCELRKEIRLLHWQVKQLTEQLQTKLEFK